VFLRLRGLDGQRAVRVVVGADVDRVNVVVAEDIVGILGCVCTRVLGCKPLSSLEGGIAKGTKADSCHAGEAPGVDLAHAAAADDGNLERGGHDG